MSRRLMVSTSCSGRFHIFDQAVQLHRHGLLQSLISDYPKWAMSRWNIPSDHSYSLLINGIYAKLAWKLSRRLNPSAASSLIESAHNFFSRRLGAHVPTGCDVFIGLSSFCLEALKRAKEEGAIAIVDHGSLHQRVERALLMEEAELTGLAIDGDLPPHWLIDKEETEFASADNVMVLSQVAKRGMIQAGIPGEKIFVNPCGVDLAHFKHVARTDDVFRIVQCGGINQRKGVQYLLAAFNELKLPKSELWFVGGGLETSSLRPLIDRCKAPNVRFLGAFPQNKLSLIYNECSVFVLASIADGFGMVVPQAMACGLPVIVTENVGAADIVNDGANGFIVPIRDVSALKEKLLYLYENPDICRTMGQSALKTVREGYTWEDYGDRLARFLWDICQK